MKNTLALKSLEAFQLMEPYFNIEGDVPSILKEAMEYSLKAGGKRLRPILIHEASMLFNGENETVFAFMAAMEMIHTYSLVHDDLSCMDNDELRHGKPATHTVYGEDGGVLCGDALLNLAFETVAKALIKNPGERSLMALKVLAESAGACGMVGGQAKEVLSKDNPITGEDIEYIYENKCGKLIKASLEIGALLGGAPLEDVKKLSKIGELIGFAFQIEDDILDIVGDEKSLGKPIGSDEKNNKFTYVACFGMEESVKRLKDMTKEAIEILETLPGDTLFLKNLFNYLTDRRS